MNNRLRAWICLNDGRRDEDTQLLIDDIKDLEARLEKAMEALRFYGDTSENTWICQLSNTTRKPISYVIGIDCDELENGFVNGGRLARKTLEEIGE